MLRSLSRVLLDSCLSDSARMIVPPEICLQHTRMMGMIFERVYPVGLHKPSKKPKLRRRHYYYKLLENPSVIARTDIECILTEYVEGLGNRGEQMMVKRRIFRNNLLPGGMAVYASPENIAMFEKERLEKGIDGTEPKLSPFARLTLRQMEKMNLLIPMSGDTECTLDKTHLKVAFRLCGVELTEDCITLPSEPVTGPGNIQIQVTVNNMESCTVNGLVYLVYKDSTKNEPQSFPDIWAPPSERDSWILREWL